MNESLPFFIDHGVQSLFPDDTHCLAGLTVPDTLIHLEHCDEICQKHERKALLKLYNSTGGKYWFNRHGNKWGMRNISHCQWEGIVCYGNTSHVIALNLYKQNLSGYVNQSLRNLHIPLGICFGQNNIQGGLNKILKSISKDVIRLDFEYNLLSGHFPGDIITEFSTLIKIQLSGNTYLSGKLPQNIGNLKALRELSIGETRISGLIPESVGQLAELRFLDLETLRMTGNLYLFQALRKLQFLHLSSNKINGSIPRDIGKWYPEMQELLLQNNNLHGDIPESLGLLTSLIYFNVARNSQLTGIIPASIGLLPKLKIFIISQTDIRGFENGFHFNTSQLSFFSARGNKKFSLPVKN